jgi:hypothetical protein
MARAALVRHLPGAELETQRAARQVSNHSSGPIIITYLAYIEHFDGRVGGAGGDQGTCRRLSPSAGRHVTERLQLGGEVPSWLNLATRHGALCVVMNLVVYCGGLGAPEMPSPRTQSRSPNRKQESAARSAARRRSTQAGQAASAQGSGGGVCFALVGAVLRSSAELAPWPPLPPTRDDDPCTPASPPTRSSASRRTRPSVLPHGQGSMKHGGRQAGRPREGVTDWLVRRFHRPLTHSEEVEERRVALALMP